MSESTEDRHKKGNADDFYKALATKESSNCPEMVNTLGYLGLYQMGEAALTDAKYYKTDGTKKNDWIGEWTKKGGIDKKDSFLQYSDEQTLAIKKYHGIIWDKYLKKYHKYEGQEILGIKLTKSGMIAAAHLVGHNKFRKFLDSGGKGKIPEDGSNPPVKCTKYLELFGNYDLDSPSTQELRQINPTVHDNNLSLHNSEYESDANKLRCDKLQRKLSKLPTTHDTKKQSPSSSQSSKDTEFDKEIDRIKKYLRDIMKYVGEQQDIPQTPTPMHKKVEHSKPKQFKAL